MYFMEKWLPPYHIFLSSGRNKNIKLISQFREKYPECRKSESSISDKYNKIIIEAIGGAKDNTAKKEEKIIRNISKNVVIEK